MTRAAGSRERDPAEASRRRALRELPSVEELAAGLTESPRPVAVRAAREAIGEAREALLAGEEPQAGALAARGRELAARMTRPSLRRVLNATGVIVHTNLGRAPLPPAALEAVVAAAGGYSNLEYDTESGERGSRQAHVEELLGELTGAEAGLAVNNCAGAVLLAAAAMAAGRELIVSRGQLVEVGGSFRIPDVVAQSGARLREVGTTNRTRLPDYEAALGESTGAILRAHQSNFRTVGFVEEPSIEELCSLGVPVIDDAGSGAVGAGIPELEGEPPVRRSVEAGAALTCFSGDKLLGGPQAGLLVGAHDAIDRCRRHPLARALRIDKLSLAALEAVLRLHRDHGPAAVPVLRMLTAGEAELRARAERLVAALASGGVRARVVESSGRAGGGSLPLLELRGPACAVDPGALGLDELTSRLRGGEPPVVGRAREGWLLLDPRTLTDADADRAAAAVCAVLGSRGA